MAKEIILEDNNNIISNNCGLKFHWTIFDKIQFHSISIVKMFKMNWFQIINLWINVKYFAQQRRLEDSNTKMLRSIRNPLRYEFTFTPIQDNWGMVSTSTEEQTSELEAAKLV